VYNNIVNNIISIDQIKMSVGKVAPKFDIKKVILFGSYANGKCTKKSDIDLLVEFNEPIVSYLKVIGVKNRMEELTGKTVDVVPCPLPHDSIIEIDKEILLYGA
jgi:predicted nucleotidyltransferase